MKQKQTFKPKHGFERTLQEYLDIISNTMRPGTIKNYTFSINAFLHFLNSNYREVTCFKDIERSPHIESWLTHLTKSRLSKGTRHIRVGCVRRFFTDINEWGWKNVPKLGLITSRDIPVPDKYLPKPLTPEDDKKLQETLRHDYKLFPQALILLRKTGMRVGELMNLEANSLKKFPSGDHILHVPMGKMHTERIIPVDSETVEIFNRILKMRGEFLPMPNERTGDPTQFLLVHKSRWRRPTYCGLVAALSFAAKKAGINKHINLHQLRHTYATELLRAGISLPALMQLLGHKDIAMTLIYADVSHEDLNRAYHQAIQKSKSMDLIPKQLKEDEKDDSELILDGIDNVITKLHSIRKDSPEGKNKKRLQRIAERLRRAYQDIENTFKSE